MAINNIFLEPDGLRVGDNQLVTSGGGVSVGQNLVVQGTAYATSGLVIPSVANNLATAVGSIRYNTTGGIDVYNGTSWSAAGSVAGSDTQVQYNNAGAAAGSSNFTWTNSTSTLLVNGTSRATISLTAPVHSTNGAVNLVLNTNGGINSGNITINQGVNGNIAVTPNGSGVVNLGDMTGAGIVTTGTITSNLTLNTNNGATSGSVVIAAGTNGNITLTPNGTGNIGLIANTVLHGVLNTATTITTNGTGNLTLSTNSGTNSGTIVINQGTNGNISLVPNGTGAVVIAALSGLLKGTSGTVSTAAASDLNSTFGSQTQNFVYAAPSGSNGNPTFRALVAGDIPGTLNSLTVTGNLIVNGTTTTINSNTVSVDDKNLELGGIAAVSPTGTITASAIVTGLSSTANIIPGSAVTSLSNNGTVTLPANTTVLSIDSATQITLNQALTGSGTASGATLNIGGATDITANQGGITLLGATNKTIIWDSTNSNWTSSEHWNIATTKSFKINNVTVLDTSQVLASATGVTVGGTSTTTVALGTNSTALSTTTVGGAITGNILRINSAAAGTATFTTNNASNLVINTNSGTTTGNITLNTGTNGNIAITPNGTGSVLVGDQSAAGTVTTGTITANLTLNTNNGTTSGSVVLTAGANGAIVVTTNGSGAVQLVTSTTQLGVLNTATTLTTNGTSNLTINTNNGTNAGNIVLNNGVNGNITAVPNGTGKIGFFTTNPVSKFTVVSAGGTVPTIAFPDATNTRYNTGIGSRQVTNIGQILDLYSGDSTANGTDLNSGHIRQTIMPNGFVGISQTQPNALLQISNSRIIGSGFNLSTVSAMDAALDTITFSAVHNLNTGDIVFYIPGSGGAIGGIFGSTANPGWQYFYYAQVIDTVTIKLHSTGYSAHAQGTAIDLIGTLPSGSHTFRKGTEWTQLTGNNGNGTLLHTYHYRHTDGADWTGASTRIQQRIDITPQGYIEFNATGGVGDVAFGAGSPGGEVFRISGTSLVLGIGNTHTAAVGRTIRMTNMSGTDISAGTMSIQGALSTGAATGGAIRFLTGTTTTTGATLQTAHERLSIDTASASTILNLSTPATTANLFTANATTINIGATASTVNIGTQASNNTLVINGNSTGGTATLNTNVTTGTVNTFAAVTTGTVNVGSANSGRVAVAFNQTSTGTTTGALTVTGGVGIGGNLNVGGTSNLNGISIGGTEIARGNAQLTLIGGGGQQTRNLLTLSNGNGAVLYGGSASTNAPESVGYGIILAGGDGNVSIPNTTASSSTTTGALVVSGGVGIGGNLNVGGIINGIHSAAVYDLDDVSASVTGLENTFALTFNQTAVAIANPFSVMVTVNGIIQPGFIYNYNAVYGGLLWTSFKGYTIVGGNIKFADSPEPGSEILIRNTGLTSNFTTPKRYPIKPAEIMLGM
jgi:hypothetical protein